MKKMAWSVSRLLLVVVVVGLNMMRHESVGQPTAGCTTALISLSSCLSYITDDDDTAAGNSSSTGSTQPSSSCCTRLASVVQSKPQCLCSALNGGAAASLGVTINQTRALALPAACNLQTPPPTSCNDGSGGAGPAVSLAAKPSYYYYYSDEEEVGESAPTIWDDDDSFPSAGGGAIASKNVPITTGAGGIPSSTAATLLINTPFNYHLHLITIVGGAILLTPL